MDEHIAAQLQAALWCPDHHDFRDLTMTSEDAEPLARFASQFSYQRLVDLREYMPPVLDIPGSGAAAHACCTLVEYFRRRYLGDPTRLSRSFIHEIALLRECKAFGKDVSLRSILKGLRRVGTPPASLVRHLESLGKLPIDSPLCYQYRDAFSDLQYFRLKARDGYELAGHIKSLLLAGIPIAFGMTVPSSASDDPRIDLQPQFDRVAGHTAGVIAGFDDDFRVSEKGAFLIHCLSTQDWGERGYGWLSYRLVRRDMLTDLWIAMQPCWLREMAQEHGFRVV